MYWLPGAIIRRFQVVEAFRGFSARQVIQDLVALRIPLGLVCQEVADVNTPVSPDHVVWDFIALQHLDQELARYSQHPSGLNGGELRVVLNDGNRLALA